MDGAENVKNEGAAASDPLAGCRRCKQLPVVRRAENAMADELFERHQCDRDRRSYERLVATHRPLVATVCRRFLRDPDDLDDAVQETFLKLAGNIDSVTGSITGWLASTAQAASIDLIRRSIRERNRRLGLSRVRGSSDGTSGSGKGAAQQIERLAAREAIRFRLHEAMLVIDPAARDVLTERFLCKTPLRVLAGRMNVSVPTASRRAAAALRELAHVLRAMGVSAASEQAVADQFDAARALADPESDEPDHGGGLRFAPDWRSADLSPLGAASASTLLAGWPRPVRVGVLISYQSTTVMGFNRLYVGTKWQVHSSMFLPAAGLQLVGVVEPSTAHRGIVESTLRDYGIVGGLIEADDETALATLDVLLLGFNYAMSASVGRAINRAVRSGVGLLNEYWTGTHVGIADHADVRELMLADSSVYKFHMPGECGDPLPATVLREHALLPGLKAATQIMVRGCGPAYRVMPNAQVLATKDYLVQPHEHGMNDLGPLPMPCYIVGQLGRGRVAVVHAWPHQWFIRYLKLDPNQYFPNLLRWLAAPRQELG
jgi:RNA polymerase sigma factor (sigma-70 family)